MKRSEMPPRKVPMPKGEKALKRHRWPRRQSKDTPDRALGALRGSQRPSRRDSGPSRKTRETVMRRDDYRCARCGLDVRCLEHSIQHRRARGMGGTRRADTNSPAALILLCGSGTTRCHGHVEAHPHEALGYGWRIPQAAADPAEWPVWIEGRGRILLDHDGGWRPA